MIGPIELIVAAFPDITKADEVLKSLKQLDQEGVVDVINAAVVAKTKLGKTTVEETGDPKAKHGALFGAVAGGLIGLLGGPVGVIVGAAAGAATGGVAADRIDMGFDDDYLKEVQDSLPLGSSAVIALVQHEWVDRVVNALEGYEAQVIRRAIKDDIVAQLSDAEED
jgi:uncharacterized membrane protein